jgi:hypothetical protein
MGPISRHFQILLFEQPNALQRIALLRIIVVAICISMLFMGPYDSSYHIDFAKLMFRAQFPFPFFTPLGEVYSWIKFLAIGSGLFALLGYRTNLFLPLFTLCYCLLNYYIHCFQEHYCMNTAHLNIALITLCFVPCGRQGSIDVFKTKYVLTPYELEKCSFALTFLGGYIAVLFFQTGLSKLIYGGIGWYLSGDTLYVETIFDGTDFGRYLTQFGWVFPFFGMTVGLFELIVPFLFLFPRFHVLFGCILLLFHLGTFLVMGISFWFLWPLYIPLYIMSQKKRAPALEKP